MGKDDDANEALTLVFRFLDTTNDGDISAKEFQLLLAIWCELWQSMQEFKDLLLKIFRSLEASWRYADIDKNKELNYAEFKKVAEYLDFDGPVKQIFFTWMPMKMIVLL